MSMSISLGRMKVSRPARRSLKSTLAGGLVIVAHGSGYRLAGSFSPGAATVTVIIDPRFAAFVAQKSADPPATCSDFVDKDALANGLQVVFFKQTVEHRREFVETGGAIEDGADDIA